MPKVTADDDSGPGSSLPVAEPLDHWAVLGARPREWS